MATTTLDDLISESGRRTGIGAAAEPLTRELLRFMTRSPGGLGAFLDRFRSAGLGTEVASFLGGASETPLPPKAVDTVIGENTVANIARRAGLAPAAASTALGYEIPKLVGMLTPGGQVPNVLPSEIQSFVDRDQVSPVAMTTVRDEEQVRPAAMATLPARRANLNWLWALLALLVLGGLLWALLSRNQGVQTAQVTPPAVTAPAVTAPAVTTPTPPAAVTTAVSALNQDLSRTVLRFPTASAVLPAASAPELQRAAERIKGLPAGTMIEVGGHTDNTGNAASNMTLSQQRADAVRDALIKAGAPAEMLTAKGYGETKPVASNDTADGRYQNRRTEFTVVGANTTTTTTTTTAPANQ